MFAVGQRIGAYRIRRRIGAGGMGEVYLAEHLHMGRKAAIKALLPELSSRPDFLARFLTEARATALLRHPGIVEIFDCDVHESGRAFIVMEFLEGETLGHCLGRIGSLAEEPDTVAAIAGQIASALGAAHAKRIVHRDLKPDNVFLVSTPEGEWPYQVKVLDFGIAKLIGDGPVDTPRTRTGSLLGTPRYMSPEQCRGSGKVDHRADIYSLGCIAFELVSGRPPFVLAGQGDLIIAHNSQPAPELSSLVPSVSPALGSLVKRMLAKEVADRPQTMLDVVREIEQLLGVPASRFAAKARVPAGFPPAATGDPTIEQAAPLPPSMTVGEPEAGSGAEIPGRLPTPTLVKATDQESRRSSTTLSQAAATGGDPGAPRRRSRPGIGLGLGAGALASVTVVLLIISGTRKKLPIETTTISASQPRHASLSVMTPTAATPAPAAQKVVTVDLEGVPAGLVVELDGKPTKVPVAIPFGPGGHRLEVTAPGFETKVLQVDGNRDRTIVLNMQAIPGREASAKTKRDERPAATHPHERSRSDSRPATRKENEGFTDL